MEGLPRSSSSTTGEVIGKVSSTPFDPPCTERFFRAAIAFLASARLSAMASFKLIAGAAFAGLAGCSGSFGRRREREGDLGTDCVRGRSAGGARPEEDCDGFALLDIVRGRAAGDFGTRRVGGEAAGRGEGLAGAGG